MFIAGEALEELGDEGSVSGADRQDEGSVSGADRQDEGSVSGALAQTETEDGSESDEEQWKVDAWRKHLELDLGIQTIPTVNVEERSDRSSEDEDGGSSRGTESSSHEVGIEIVSEDSTDDDQAQDEAEERHSYVSLPGKKKMINKHLRRRLGHQAREIREAWEEETRKDKQHSKLPSRVDPVRLRRSSGRTWSVLDVFTWTCAISIAAAARGWLAHEPACDSSQLGPDER